MNWIVVKKFPLETDLSSVTGYLREQRIAHQIYEERGLQVIAVADPRMVGPISQFLQEIEQGKLIIETDTKTQPQAPASSPGFFQQIKEAPVTSLLILCSLVGAILVAIDPDFVLVNWFLFNDMNRPSSLVWLHQPWRLFTPAFLHFGVAHVLFNSLWMWDLGRRLEFFLGRFMLILFFLLTAAISNGVQYWWQPHNPFGGMSGVIYALVGFMMISHKLRPNPYTAVPPVVLGTMLFWLVLCMTGALDVLIGGGVANGAHLGGLIAGCLFALIPFKRLVKN